MKKVIALLFFFESGFVLANTASTVVGVVLPAGSGVSNVTPLPSPPIDNAPPVSPIKPSPVSDGGINLFERLSSVNCATFGEEDLSKNRIRLQVTFASTETQIGVTSQYGKKGTTILRMQDTSNAKNSIGYHLVFLGISTQVTKEQNKNRKPLKVRIKKGDRITLDATQSFIVSNAIIGQTYTIEFAAVLPPFSTDTVSGYSSYCALLKEEGRLHDSIKFAISTPSAVH